MQIDVANPGRCPSGAVGSLPPSVSWLRASALGATLGVALLVLCALPIVRHFLFGMGGDSVVRSIVAAPEIASQLLWRVAAFAATAVGLHALLGLIAVALAWLTEACFPSQRARLKVAFLWLTLLFLWILLANIAWFPRSELGEPYARIAGTTGFMIANVVMGSVLTIAVAGMLLVVASRAALRAARHEPRRLRRFALLGSTVGAIALSVAVGANRFSLADQPASGPPNIIVIGVDSLRLELLAQFGGSGDTPEIDQLLREARVFGDTITPLARTFPSWVSILTGRHPRSTGAVFNLIGRETITPGRTLAHILGERGYRTVFATDEVRFSNIDRSYGFHDVITPVMGASDFVLGSVADMPLINLVNATPVGRVVLPDIHANRAAASTYVPGSFSTLLERELDLHGPTLLAVHFTLTHWPYYWADAPRPPARLDSHEARFAEYRAAVRMVDAQVGQLLDTLREQGELNNALVILLSDHGEAMQRTGDSMLRMDAPKQLVAYQSGHGNSVLSPSQYQVLLAFAGFGSMRNVVAPGLGQSPASLEDISPTVVDLLKLQTGNRFDGLSLRDSLKSGASAMIEARVRFTETDFTLPRLLAGEVNVKWLAETAVDYYQINPESGWVELRAERLPSMMAYKERAAMYRDWLMAALPATGGRTLYGLVHRRTGEARVLETIPESPSEPAFVLYRALQERFRGELRPPARDRVARDPAAGADGHEGP